jgi:hypothetical protein
MLAYALCLDAYFAYPSNLSPPHGLHGFLIGHIMRWLSQNAAYNQRIGDDKNIPRYCGKIKFSRKLIFPKIG